MPRLHEHCLSSSATNLSKPPEVLPGNVNVLRKVLDEIVYMFDSPASLVSPKGVE